MVLYSSLHFFSVFYNLRLSPFGMGWWEVPVASMSFQCGIDWVLDYVRLASSFLRHLFVHYNIFLTFFIFPWWWDIFLVCSCSFSPFGLGYGEALLLLWVNDEDLIVFWTIRLARSFLGHLFVHLIHFSLFFFFFSFFYFYFSINIYFTMIFTLLF